MSVGEDLASVVSEIKRTISIDFVTAPRLMSLADSVLDKVFFPLIQP